MHAEHADNNDLNELSGRVIGCAFTVLNTLGAGFLEKVYENALAYEVRATGLCQGAHILGGEDFVDLLIDDMLLVELETVKALDDAHMPPSEARNRTANNAKYANAGCSDIASSLAPWQARA